MRRRNVLAFPIRFLIRSVYPVSRSRLVIVAVCGIPCRLACRLVPPSRSVVSFPVCFFFVSALGRLARRLALSRLVICVSSSCFLIRFAHLRSSLCSSVRPVFVSSLTPFVFVSSPFVFVSSPFAFVSSLFVVIIVIVVVVCVSLPLPHSLRSSFRSRHRLPSLRLVPRRRCSICVSLDVPYETADAPDVPLICSLGRLPLTIAIGEQMGNRAGKNGACG